MMVIRKLAEIITGWRLSKDVWAWRLRHTRFGRYSTRRTTTFDLSAFDGDWGDGGEADATH